LVGYISDFSPETDSTGTVIPALLSYDFGHSFGEIPMNLLAKIDEMGMDSSEELTDLEISYFEARLGGQIERHALANKRVGFYFSHLGKSDKRTYFVQERERLHDPYTASPINAGLYLLDEVTKEATGGYDAVVVCWEKVVLTRKAIVRRMKPRK
jgi:hypothetical protein